MQFHTSHIENDIIETHIDTKGGGGGGGQKQQWGEGGVGASALRGEWGDSRLAGRFGHGGLQL